MLAYVLQPLLWHVSTVPPLAEQVLKKIWRLEVGELEEIWRLDVGELEEILLTVGEELGEILPLKELEEILRMVGGELEEILRMVGKELEESFRARLICLGCRPVYFSTLPTSEVSLFEELFRKY